METTAGMSATVRGTALSLPVFTLSLFLSAFLMFMLQPMVGKMLLPVVGGTPAGWIVAMAFFQAALLAGYTLAWAMAQFSLRVHALLYLGFLCAGGIFLPVAIPAGQTLPAGLPPEAGVSALLAVTAGFPFVALAATASTLQRLFMATGHASAPDPYFLYAASNLGSFGGLLLYPLAAEPFLSIPAQSLSWSGGYAALVLFSLACAALAGRPADARSPAATPAEHTHPRQKLLWVALAFVPASLLMGVTTHITTDVFSAPMIWALPLGLYLLTFVVAFSKRGQVMAAAAMRLHPVAVAGALACLFIVAGQFRFSFAILACHLFAFAVISLACHARLAQSRPQGGDERPLPEFYLLVALGGALGGALNAFLAPVVFDSAAEYPLALIASLFLSAGYGRRFTNAHTLFYLAGCGLMVIFAMLHKNGLSSTALQNAFLAASFITVTLHPRSGIALGILLVLFAYFNATSEQNVLSTRNFYGIARVYDTTVRDPAGEELRMRTLQHGTTIHGQQVLSGGMETEPTSYFTREGPLGDIFEFYDARDVAAIGLGAGTLHCHATPESAFTFIEIDPAMAVIAQEHFTFLTACKGRQPPRIIIGDGRIELEKLAGETFSMIVVDAFSSDVVPAHLLTAEAMETYRRHLKPGGVVLFHISNRYFNLEKVIGTTASSIGLAARWTIDAKPESSLAHPSKWIVAAEDDNILIPLEPLGWIRTDTMHSMLRPWRDDHTDFLHALAF